MVINFPPSLTLTAPAFKMKKAALELILECYAQLDIHFGGVKILKLKNLTQTLCHILALRSH